MRLDGEAQGIGEGQGGASIPVCEAPLWLCQGALPWIGQEHGASGGAAGVWQPADGGASSGRVAWAAEGPKGPMEPLPVHNGPDGAKPKGWSYRQQRVEGSSHPPLPLQLRQSKP